MLHDTTYNKETNTFRFVHTKQIKDIEGNDRIVLDFTQERTLEELNLEIAGYEEQKANLEKTIERVRQEKEAAESLI